jgi:hypothetical protein
MAADPAECPLARATAQDYSITSRAETFASLSGDFAPLMIGQTYQW